MTRSIRWTMLATEQLQEAVDYLEDARSGIGYSFFERVETILQLAAENPSIFPKVPDVLGEIICVLTVWHGARAPRGWRRG